MVLVASLMVMFTSTAFADDTKVTVGVKAWQNKWEEKNDTTFDFGSSLMVGPTLNVRFSNNWFVGGSYLVTTQDYETNDFVLNGDKLTISRSDLDLFAGYMFTPQFGMFFGYKSISNDAKYTYKPLGLNNSKLADWDITGPGIGIVGNIPLNETIALYGNLAIMFMKSKFTSAADGSSDTTDLTGASLEAGVSFAFAESFSANLGYKVQSFSGDDNAGGTTTDTYSGVIFALNYRF
jgi:opacity protein-like surface antigen